MLCVLSAALGATAVFADDVSVRLPMVPQPREWKATDRTAAKIDPAKATYAIRADDALGAEGYALSIAADGSVSATAPTEQGLFWARRTVDQLAAAKTPVPAGTMRDWPKYRVRGVMLDVGRKFVRLETLRAMLKDLVHYKMNEFHIHLNDDGATQFTGPEGYSAFRLECDTYPGLTAKDGHYTKAEFRSFIKEAAAMGVTVIPEIDSPAHSGCFIKYRKGLDGKYGPTHLALDKPEVRDFMEKLFAEYLDGDDPVFAGKYVHVGTDEYDKREAENFRAYTDWAFKMVRRHGHEPRAWGSLDHAAGKTPVVADRNVQMDIWHNPYYDPVHALDAGYSIVAIPDLNLYVVPAAGFYFDYLVVEDIFQNWEPCTIAGRVIDPNHPGLLGGKFAIWNDLSGNGISEDDVIDRFLHAIPTIAEKTWTGAQPGLGWREFEAIARNVGEAPGVNLQDRVSGANGAAGANDRAIGWSDEGGWTVDFELVISDAARDVVLFDDGTSQVVLFAGGKIGFARDGYDWRAERALPVGKKLGVRFAGDAQGVTVTVDGAAVGDTHGLTKLCRHWNGKMKAYRSVRTLHFPLQEAHHPGVAVRNVKARTVFASPPVNEAGLKPTPVVWPDVERDAAPQTWKADFPEKDGVKAIWYEGVPYKGKPTRVFAYLAMPKVAPGKTVPGIVLVHGGLGSAFRRWAKHWADRGYAAISMDTCGCVSGNEYGDEQRGHRRHEWAGPQGWGAFDKAGDPVEDQWAYHAVAAVVRANSLLRSLPGVDPNRIGLTGVSWGGYLTCMAAGVDRRFAFAAPVYGCGFLDDDSVWNDKAKGTPGEADFQKWCGLFDPRHYLCNARGPFLFVDGSNDFAYPLDSLQKTCEALTPGCCYYRATRVRMPHGHIPEAEHPKELEDFADWLLKGGKDYPFCTGASAKDGVVTCGFKAPMDRIVRVELEYTKDAGRWQDRTWETVPMTWDDAKASGSAKMPAGVTAWYVNAFTEDGKCVSSDLVQIP